MTYTIIDVETTGKTNRITEISIFRWENGKVVDEFTSLVDPEVAIPEHITRLTGIDDEMVAGAPTFSQIAKDVISITEGSIFVAHSVNFDYNVIRGEFKRLEIDYKRKKLCTVRLSRKLLPNHQSYSLGKICADLDIQINGRHRARGDAEATVILFEKMMAKDNWKEVLNSFFKKSSKEATLPPNLPSEVFEAIPSKTGIYFFKDKLGEVIYVGKAKDLRKRVLGHFYNKSKKELDLCRETRDITFDLSGTEMVALLMEDAAIKHHFPKYNSASKRGVKRLALVTYSDQNGILHLAINNLKLVSNPITIFYSINEARKYVEKLCATYNLCPKYCHLLENVENCQPHFLNTCEGICDANESIENYNLRINSVIATIKNMAEDRIIKGPGRTVDETSFVYIDKGLYKGYGFINQDIVVDRTDMLQAHLILQKDNPDVHRIIRQHAPSQQLKVQTA